MRLKYRNYNKTCGRQGNVINFFETCNLNLYILSHLLLFPSQFLVSGTCYVRVFPCVARCFRLRGCGGPPSLFRCPPLISPHTCFPSYLWLIARLALHCLFSAPQLLFSLASAELGTYPGPVPVLLLWLPPALLKHAG